MKSWASYPKHGVSEQLLIQYFMNCYRWKRRWMLMPTQHWIPEQLIQYFYKRMLPMEKKMMDATDRSALVNKTP